MKKYWVGLIACLVLGQAEAASFDCGKAATKVEKLICTDAELSKADEQLATAYKTALQNKKQADAIRKTQEQWLKERNGCSDAMCVKQAYQTRLAALISSSWAVQSAIKKPPFTLLKGKGVAVCEAYLKRLNVSDFGYYEKLPTCGRPEDDSVEGFTKLNRVSLTVEQITDLWGGC